MPICKSCGKHAEVLKIDPCPNCNAKNWARPAASDLQRASNDLLGYLGGIVGIALAIAVALSGLWLLIAITKWIWQHS